MYELLSGKHPLWDKNKDTRVSYKEKIVNFKELNLDLPCFSDLAKSLLQKLCAHNPIHRYSSAEALSHPWITRQGTDIPRSFIEQEVWCLEVESKLRKAISACVFGSISRRNLFSKDSESTVEISFSEYRTKIMNEDFDEVVQQPSIDNIEGNEDLLNESDDESLDITIQQEHHLTLNNSTRSINKKNVRPVGSTKKNLKLNVAPNTKFQKNLLTTSAHTSPRAITSQ